MGKGIRLTDPIRPFKIMGMARQSDPTRVARRAFLQSNPRDIILAYFCHPESVTTSLVQYKIHAPGPQVRCSGVEGSVSRLVSTVSGAMVDSWRGSLMEKVETALEGGSRRIEIGADSPKTCLNRRKKPWQDEKTAERDRPRLAEMR